MSHPSELKFFIFLTFSVIFSLIGIFFSKNKDPVSRYYRRIDFIIGGSLSFIILIIQLYSLIYFEGSNDTIDSLSITILTLLFLSSGLLNIVYKKQINSDAYYKFGVSFFLCGGIGVFYLLAEWFLK